MKDSRKNNTIIRWLLLLILTVSVGCAGSSAQLTIVAGTGRQIAMTEEYYTEAGTSDISETVTEEEMMELTLSENLIQKLQELSAKTAVENSVSEADAEKIADTEEVLNTEKVTGTEEPEDTEESADTEKPADTEDSADTEEFADAGENTETNKTTDTRIVADEKITEDANKQTTESVSDSENRSESETDNTVSSKDAAESKKSESNTDTNSTDSKASASTSVVDSYSFSAQTTQVIDVITSGSYGTLTLYNKSDNEWTEVFSTSCRVGKNGISSNKKEGDKKTPAGYFTLGQAFGVSSDPGSTRDYLKVTKYHYWVDDSDSSYYNQLVDSSITGITWDSAEHLIDYPTAYKYAIAINYNTDCTPGNGSAIFLHCSTGNATSGCVSVSESYMVKILKALRSDTIIYIH